MRHICAIITDVYLKRNHITLVLLLCNLLL